jgi:hypothetical protein
MPMGDRGAATGIGTFWYVRYDVRRPRLLGRICAENCGDVTSDVDDSDDSEVGVPSSDSESNFRSSTVFGWKKRTRWRGSAVGVKMVELLLLVYMWAMWMLGLKFGKEGDPSLGEGDLNKVVGRCSLDPGRDGTSPRFGNICLASHKLLGRCSLDRRGIGLTLG